MFATQTPNINNKKQKDMKTNLFNSSLFRYAQRLAIVCVFLSISAAAGASTYYSTMTAKVSTASTGHGKVYVAAPDNNNPPTDADYKDEPDPAQYSAKDKKHQYKLYAKANPGYAHEGWVENSASIQVMQNSGTNPYIYSASEWVISDNSNNRTSKTLYAVFKPLVKLPEPNQVKITVNASGTAPVMVILPEVYKTSELRVSITGNDAQNSWFQLAKGNQESSYAFSLTYTSEISATGSTPDLTFYVRYVGTLEDAPNVTNVFIRVEAPNEAPDVFWDIPIKVSADYDTYQFLKPRVLGREGENIDCGSYSATLADPDETVINISNADSEPIQLQSDGHYSVILKASAKGDYKFYAWYKITFNDDGTEKAPVLVSQLETYGPVNFKESAKIYPLYLPKTQALFVIKEDENKKQYYDLQEALNVASATDGYSTVVFNAPTKGTTGTLSPKADGTSYVVPAGVTLLIPGESTYRCRTTLDKDKGRDDFIAGSSSSNYSKLILEDNTEILLDGGNLSIYATISQQQNYNGRPLTYGWIEMGENTSISTVEGKPSVIYAMGYITGKESASVTLHDQSTAYESFQFTDFRGGMAMININILNIGAGMLKNDKRVFPVQQYYVQNIEVPMTIKWGATLKAIGVVHVAFHKSIVNIDEQCLAAADLLATASGFVYMEQDVDIHRVYNTERDVMQYTIQGKGKSTSSARIGNIYMDLGTVYGTDLKMDTKGFVMPIANNMELTLDNLTATSPNMVGLLAGSKIWIKENAVLNVEAPLYVYDKNENKVTYDGTTTGFYAAGNKELVPITYTPNGVHKDKRTVENLTSAEVKVDGTLNITKAGLYTTASGADIISSVNGATIQINELSSVTSDTKLYQARQSGSSTDTKVNYPEITINSAWLKNSDGTYVETANAPKGTTYQFYVTGYDESGAPEGIWSLPPAKVVENSWEGTTIKATMPNRDFLMTIQCQVANVTDDNYKTAFTASLEGSGFAFAGTDGKFENSVELNGSTLSIEVNYTPKNITSESHKARLTLTNATISTPEYTFSTELIATEEYIPAFEVNPNEVIFSTTAVGQQSSKEDAFAIIPSDDNVATLSKNDGLTWSYQLDKSEFNYTGIVDGDLDNENNDVTFQATSSGTHRATLTITATYQPAEGEAQSTSKEITLIGTSQTVNTLEFDMPNEINVTEKNVSVKFKNVNNSSGITVTIDDANIAKLTKKADGTYEINALSAGTFTLTAEQSEDGSVGSIEKTHTITVKKLTPNPQWNWGVLYGNQSYSMPFESTTIVDGEWRLEKIEDLANALVYDTVNHTANVMNLNVGTNVQATFSFIQNETPIYEACTLTFLSDIYPDPRLLTLTINNQAEYEIIVNNQHSEGVSCDPHGLITLPPSGYLIVQFIGIPDELMFSLLGDASYYDDIQVDENADVANADSWVMGIAKSDKNTWSFTQTNSTCVRITNHSEETILLQNLTVTEKVTYERNTYYAMTEAGVFPQGAGTVSARGSYSDTNIDDDANYEDVFTTWSEFAETTSAYSMLHELLMGVSSDLRFRLQAQSASGYYFKEWTVERNSIITDELKPGDKNSNYELTYVVPVDEFTYKGYSFDTYINLFCQQYQDICAATKPESGEPNPEAVAYMNAGALSLIPYITHTGRFQANFALAEVISAENVDWGTVMSPNPSDVEKRNVVFNILGDDKNDFVASIVEEGKGFTFTEDDITLSTTYNTYTVNVSYTPQDIHGPHTTEFRLSRVAVEGVTEESTKTITLTATEDLTPSFELEDGNFGSGTLGQTSMINIVPANKNKVAQVNNPSKLKWEATLSENAPFEIVSVGEDGTCQLRYFRTESGEKSATLTIKATYTDSKGKQLPFSATCTLLGSSTADKAVNTLELKQDLVLYVDDDAVNPFSIMDMNNAAPITITLPAGCTALVVENNMIKPSGDFTTGAFTITATQDENEYFQASGDLTTTVTVKKHTPEVTWNWSTLYFGQTYDTPITTNSDGSLTISALDDKNIVHYDDNTKTLSVEPLTEGEYEVDFSVVIAESFIYERYEATHSATIYKDPRHLRVDVNTELTYRSVTIADQTGKHVSFADGGIHFADVAGSDPDSRQWTMYFIGVPDELYFTPVGNNAWEIKESDNGVLWETTFASSQLPAGKPFSMPLRPNTTCVRISYAVNANNPSNGVLNSFYITALEGVKANVDGLYMPIAADVTNNPTTKQVILHYTSQEDLTISTSDPLFTVDENTLPKVEVDTYGEKTIVVTSRASDEKEGRVYVKNKAGDNLLELPIYSFTFPQRLPIQLATDDPQRFYYTSIATYYVAWDKDERIINFQNAPSNTSRSVTFAFDGAPTLMRFNHTAGERGTWTIRESANNADWYEANTENRVVSGNEIEQGLLSTTRYVQLTYTSAYSERVDVSNLIIVGDASVTTDVTVLELTDVEPTKNLTVTAFNLADFNVSVDNTNFTVGTIDKSGLGASVAEVLVPITWAATTAVEYATLTITNPNDNDAVLATVELIGTKQSISDPTNIGIYTGLAENITKLNGTFEGTTRRPVDLSNAFDEATRKKALFDYLFVYGETSTMDGSTTIVTPNGQRGSNAKTPCYIYKRDGDTYKLYKVVDNVNSEDKAWDGYIPVEANGISTRVYITGFAPYASTGYTKEDEGVWQFRGQAGSKLDVYLEDCYIYSRYKTIDGHSFLDRDNGESFGEQYARGSGGVLVFECASVNNENTPFSVNIHTMDRNLLKSHYGCFMSSFVGRAYQVSSPVQIHLISTDVTATTHLTFDDEWPKSITRTMTDGVVTAESVDTKRTNGFLSLQKQVNNAPSIDMGSPKTVVNFNGGQVELQNAQNVSDNYKTTLAISYRGGKFAGYFLAHGVGTDEVSGTVNFNDGTTTVIPMTVDERYRQYYLMDEDENGNELATTSTLRCPKNTYVYGGSHCMMRACNDPTSKGGAPLSHDGADAVRLGLYKYPAVQYTTGEGDSQVTHKGGWIVIDGGNGLVQIPEDNIPSIKVGEQVARKYNVESVMPNDNGTPNNPADDYLNFWVPAGYDDSVTPEVDLKISYWKAAMTRIKAEYASYGGSVGGDVKIGDDSDVETELVYNFLYCALDNDIKDVISKKEVINGQEVHSYAAPVKHPAAQGYLEIRPSYVSDSAVHYVKNLKPYKVQNRVYYITPIPSADNWMTFTAPFDVENLYVVETYDEKALSALGVKSEIKIAQARHNADFAAFFGVALALGSDRDFDDIYANYMGWARLQDVGKYEGTYNLRGKHLMEYYDGTNWSTANYYLYENQDTWTINADGAFDTQWTLPNTEDNILMNQGKTYSLLFPFCTGCWEYDEDGNLAEERTMWDYWSGKFIIFESTLGNEDNPHVIDGLNDTEADIDNVVPQSGEAHIMGNTSFGELNLTNEHLHAYNSINPMLEHFEYAENAERTIWPTNAFMLADIPDNPETEMPARRILRTGEIIYDKPDDDNNGNQNGTTGNMPTVGGGNDMFITAIEGGINIAVAAPQVVRVLSSTGSVIFAGTITTATDVLLPTSGIYIVSGENEVQKILF